MLTPVTSDQNNVDALNWTLLDHIVAVDTHPQASSAVFSSWQIADCTYLAIGVAEGVTEGDAVIVAVTDGVGVDVTVLVIVGVGVTKFKQPLSSFVVTSPAPPVTLYQVVPSE